MTTAREVIDRHGMRPHPEGGWYVETWRDAEPRDGGRPAASAILFLLTEGQRSHWHRVDAAEVWQWSGGGPIELRIAGDDGSVSVHRLDTDEPQAVVPAGRWQAARPLRAWGLVGCIVAPAFRFEGFELAPDGWEPGA